MKKLLLMIAAVAALSFTACDNAAQNDNAAANTDSVPAFAVEQFDQALAAATDSAGVDSLITTANAEVQRLIEAGDNEGAANLLAQVKEIIAKNADKIKAFMPGITEYVNQKIDAMNLSPEFKALADSASSKLAAKAVETVDGAKEAVEGAKDAVEGAGKAAVEEGKAKVEEGKKALKEAANKEVDKQVDKAAGAVKDALKGK